MLNQRSYSLKCAFLVLVNFFEKDLRIFLFTVGKPKWRWDFGFLFLVLNFILEYTYETLIREQQNMQTQKHKNKPQIHIPRENPLKPKGPTQ